MGGTLGGGELEPSPTPTLPPTLALRQRSCGGSGAGWSERTRVQTRLTGGDVYVRSGVAGIIGACTSGVHDYLGAVGRPDRPIGVPEWVGRRLSVGAALWGNEYGRAWGLAPGRRTRE